MAGRSKRFSIPNAANASGPYPSYDLAGLESGFSMLSPRCRNAMHRPGDRDGAWLRRVLVDGDKPVLPMMDYDAVSPPAIDEAYRRIAPRIAKCFAGSVPAPCGSPATAVAAERVSRRIWPAPKPIDHRAIFRDAARRSCGE